MSEERLLLVGASGFGRMVAEMAMLQYDCAFVDDGQSVGVEICGIPVVGDLANLPELRKDYGLLVVGIGNNQFRAQVYEKAKALGYGFPNIVAPVPTSVHTPSWDVVVWCCKTPVSRTVHLWETVFW